MRAALPLLLSTPIALASLACDPVYSVDLRVVATAGAQQAATKPAQVLLRTGGYPDSSTSPDAGASVHDSRLIVICDAAAADIEATREYGGVCGGAMSFTAYLVPISQADADAAGCGVLAQPTGVERPWDIPPDAIQASGTAFGNIAHDECAEGDVTLTLRLEAPAP